MSGIFGALGINDHERVFLSTLGQSTVYDAVQETLRLHNEDMQGAIDVFVERQTEDHKLRYKLAGGGRLQRMGGQAPTAAVKAYGGWDVALPLEDFGATIASFGLEFAYMTSQDLNRHLDTVMIQNANTVRFEILKALLNNTQDTFTDKHWGSLSIEPLANGDAVVFPPVLGSESEATDDHYLESGYAASSISDTNDPFVTIANELEEHFGAPTGGSNIVCFINNAQTAKVKALTDFREVVDRYITPGDQENIPNGLPTNLPGRIIGRHEGAGVWVVEWRWMPAAYIVGIHYDAPKPLLQRIHPSFTGLGTGLRLVAENDKYPFTMASYENYFGFGAGNRLNGVVMELGTGGTYSIPSGYS